MIVILVLLGGGVAVTAAAPTVLARGSWRIRHPLLAIRAWLITAGVGAGCFAGSVAVAAGVVVSHASAPGTGGIDVTVAALFTWTGLAGTGAVAALLMVRAEPISAARSRGELAAALLAARAGERVQYVGEVEVVTVRADQVIACAASDGRVLVSTLVADALPPLAVRAIVEHERAHISRHHDLIARVAAVNESAFPFLPGARHFRRTIGLLSELVADDDAARLVGPAAVCNALTGMAELTSAPEPGLGLRAERLARMPIRARTRLERLAPVEER